MYFPRVDAAADVAPTPSSFIPRGRETVLLVEDEELLRTATRDLLEGFGYHVLEASNGQAALGVTASYTGRIHVLLTDVIMPVIGGRETAERLRRLRPDLKVLYMSGYTDDAIIRHGVLPSDVVLLQKPFTGGALARKLRGVLDSPGNGGLL
jgi:two-component system cell cycle sensor histidine kinase/response regulator CckA